MSSVGKLLAWGFEGNIALMFWLCNVSLFGHVLAQLFYVIDLTNVKNFHNR